MVGLLGARPGSVRLAPVCRDKGEAELSLPTRAALAKVTFRTNPANSLCGLPRDGSRWISSRKDDGSGQWPGCWPQKPSSSGRRSRSALLPRPWT
eukprot:scaffold351_cov248-Pinguiococcus_pyrenoidosus.AAC.13